MVGSCFAVCLCHPPGHSGEMIPGRRCLYRNSACPILSMQVWITREPRSGPAVRASMVLRRSVELPLLRWGSRLGFLWYSLHPLEFRLADEIFFGIGFVTISQNISRAMLLVLLAIFPSTVNAWLRLMTFSATYLLPLPLKLFFFSLALPPYFWTLNRLNNAF